MGDYVYGTTDANPANNTKVSAGVYLVQMTGGGQKYSASINSSGQIFIFNPC